MHGDLIATFQYLKGIYQEAGRGLFIRKCSVRTSTGSKLKEGKFRLSVRKAFFTCEDGEVVEQVAQGDCKCPCPGIVQSLEQTGIMGGVPPCLWWGDWD